MAVKKASTEKKCDTVSHVVTASDRWRLVCAVTPAIVHRLSDSDPKRVADRTLTVVNAVVAGFQRDQNERTT